jgi:hypothetical protein
MNRVVVPARQATHPGGIGSLESTLELLKSLKNLGSDCLHQRRIIMSFLVAATKHSSTRRNVTKYS